MSLSLLVMTEDKYNEDCKIFVFLLHIFIFLYSLLMDKKNLSRASKTLFIDSR